MPERCDVLIVGAGPAGAAAAVELAEFGLDASIVDEAQGPGGQMWQASSRNRGTPLARTLGSKYQIGEVWADRLRSAGVRYAPETSLWHLEPAWRGYVTTRGVARTIDAGAILLATGARERAVPFPGWTLPGVMTVGAAQILLKTAGQVPADGVWIAGSGPLPLLYAMQVLELGGRIAGWLDTTPRGGAWRALPHAWSALFGTTDLLRGLWWLTRLRWSGLPTARRVTHLEAVGSNAVEAIRYRVVGGPPVTVPASLLLVHEGFAPDVHATLVARCHHRWQPEPPGLVPELDAWGMTSRDGLYAAGDIAGIAGAEAAVLRGRIAGLGLAHRLGKLSEAEAVRRAAPLRRSLRRHLGLRRFLDALYPARPEHTFLSEDTLVCRCEEVTAGQVRAAAREYPGGVDHVKAHTRAGMGPCQGRQCGSAVSQLLAQEYGCGADQVGFFRLRPPLKPVTLRELAELDAEHPST